MFRHSDDDDEDGGGAGNNVVGGEAAASEEGPHHIPKSPEYAACAAAATAAAKKAMSTATTEVKVGGVSFAPPTIQSSTRTRGSAMKQTNDDDYVEVERNHNDHQNVVDRHHSGYNNEEVDAEHALLQLATAPSWGSIIDIQKVETFDAQEDSSRSGSSSRAHSVNSNVITPASLPRKSTSYDANFIYPPSSPIKSTRTEDEDVRSSPVVEEDDEYDNDEEHPGGEEWMPPPSNFTRGRPLGGRGYYDGGSLNTLQIPPPPPHVRPQFIRPGGSSYAASYGHPRLVDSSSRDSNESSTYASGRIQAVGRQDEWDAHAHYQQHQQPWSIVSHSRSDEQQQGGSNEWDPPRPTRKPMVPPGGYPTYHYHPSHPHHPSYPPHHADYCSGIKRSSSTSGTVGGGGVYPPGGPPPRGGGGDGSLYPPMHYQHGYPHTTHHSGYSLGVYDGGPYRSSHPNSALPPHYPPPQGMGFAGGIKEEVDDDYYGVAHTSSSSLNSANNDVEMKAPRPQFQNVKRGKPASSAASGGAGGGTMKQHTGVDTIEGGIMSHLYQKKGRVYDVMTGEAITTPARTKQPIRRRRRNPTEKAAAAAAMAAAAAAAMRERNAAKQTAGSLSVDKNKENNSVDMEDRDNDGRMVEGGDLVPSPFSEEELKTLGSGDDEDIPAASK